MIVTRVTQPELEKIDEVEDILKRYFMAEGAKRSEVAELPDNPEGWNGAANQEMSDAIESALDGLLNVVALSAKANAGKIKEQIEYEDDPDYLVACTDKEYLVLNQAVDILNKKIDGTDNHKAADLGMKAKNALTGMMSAEIEPEREGMGR